MINRPLKTKSAFSADPRYLDMLTRERSAALITTDSGGVNKETFFCGVPCVTFRNETERVELIEAGWNRLASPADTKQVVASILGALGIKGQAVKLYGDGDAESRIAEIICNWRGSAESGNNLASFSY